MPELRGKTFPDFKQEAIDTDTIRFKDKNREKLRKKRLAELKEKRIPLKKNFIKNKSWSKQKNKQDKKKKKAAKRKHDEVCYSFVSVKEIVQKSPKMSIRWKCSHSQTIQDVDELFLHQIWLYVALLHLFTNACSAVNGCRQNERPNSW